MSYIYTRALMRCSNSASAVSYGVAPYFIYYICIAVPTMDGVGSGCFSLLIVGFRIYNNI